MNPLPTSIETALLEAGCTQTEVIVLRKLIDGEALTLRELGAKTGKSNGVLDQATKKLLTKMIVTKQEVNGVPKFALSSIESIGAWLEQDVRNKREVLTRKFHSIETFLQTLSKDQKRPEMKYFTDTDGLAQAYRALVHKNQEIRAYIPFTFEPDDDPLRDFFVEYFRDRRRKGAFMRVIAPDTALGKRYEARDAFEYRKTIVIPQASFPFAFEKYITGDTLACIDRKNKKACFIRFPEYVESERIVFDQFWQMQTEAQKHTAMLASANNLPLAQEKAGEASLSTRTISGIREFFISPRSIVTFTVFAAIAAAIAFGLYKHTEALNLQRVRERVQSIAATAAFQFDPKDVNALQIENDWKKPEWAKVVDQLKEIRENNAGAKFAYMFRKSKTDPNKLEFIADSHSINPFANSDNDPNNDVDISGDGKVENNGEDLLQWPGQPYPDPPIEALEAFNGVTSTKGFYSDQWGTMMSGYAPIHDAQGDTVAVVSADIDVSAFKEMNNNTFSFIPYFLGAFFLFVLIRLSAFNLSLFREAWKILQIRKLVVSATAILLLSFCTTFILYLHTLNVVKEEVGQRLLSIAATAASQFDAKDLEKLHTKQDMQTAEYQKVFSTLNEIRRTNEDIQWVYIQRTTEKPNIVEFIADADTNYNLPEWIDENQNGIEEPKEASTPTGMKLELGKSEPTYKKAIIEPTAEPDFISTQWGKDLSGYAPIKDMQGKTVAILGIDMNVSDVFRLTNEKFSFWLWFTGGFSVLMLLYLLLNKQLNFTFLKSTRPKEYAISPGDIFAFLSKKKIALILGIVSTIGFLVTLGLYFYTLNLQTQEIGEKMASLAAVGAQQISADDLEKFHTKEDMKKPEYQKVFETLNSIRGKSSDILWVSILRPVSKNSNDWEFAADADSNYNLPHIWEDINKDGKMDSEDENVWPGFVYDISQSPVSAKVFKTKFSSFEIASDKWGHYISGAAPIIKNDSSLAVLTLDFDRRKLIETNRKIYFPWLTLFGIYPVILLFIQFILKSKNNFND